MLELERESFVWQLLWHTLANTAAQLAVLTKEEERARKKMKELKSE